MKFQLSGVPKHSVHPNQVETVIKQLVGASNKLTMHEDVIDSGVQQLVALLSPEQLARVALLSSLKLQKGTVRVGLLVQHF